MKSSHTLGVLLFALGSSLPICAGGVAAVDLRIPLVAGLTVTGAASERQGDYEPSVTVDSIDSDGSLHLTASADLPNPDGGKPIPVQFRRDVRAVDLKDGRTYKYLFSSGEVEFAGTTALGTSSMVLSELRAHHATSVTLDGRPGGLAAMIGGLLGAIQAAGDQNVARQDYPSGTAKLDTVEPTPVPYRIIVNNALASLLAWHVKGSFSQNDESVSVEWYILDDPSNPLTLCMIIGKERLEMERISYPAANEAGALERQLSEQRRAVVYGIYFDFNSATLKGSSETTLRTIVAVLIGHPDWSLNVEGHTDNIGGDASNQELSARRAAAVKAALVARGIPATHLNTAGYGASVPRETNTTLAGRARNRRVELTRQ